MTIEQMNIFLRILYNKPEKYFSPSEFYVFHNGEWISDEYYEWLKSIMSFCDEVDIPYLNEVAMNIVL